MLTSKKFIRFCVILPQLEPKITSYWELWTVLLECSCELLTNIRWIGHTLPCVGTGPISSAKPLIGTPKTNLERAPSYNVVVEFKAICTSWEEAKHIVLDRDRWKIVTALCSWWNEEEWWWWWWWWWWGLWTDLLEYSREPLKLGPLWELLCNGTMTSLRHGLCCATLLSFKIHYT